IRLFTSGSTCNHSCGPGSSGTFFQTTASTDNWMTCDPEKLVSYLTGNPQASEAWVRALNSDRALS
ncbi:MAG: hypothetical protein M3319_02435, partial [Actinomycetota bacterium]|nr:hypothetical protein [Actinomycetota bacterium]